MKSLIVGILCLGAGLLGGAWSARGEVGMLRTQEDRLRRDLDRARKTKTAADLAMVARLGQAEPGCKPAPPALRAAPGVPPPPGAPPTASPDDKDDNPFSPKDRKLAFDEFSADLGLSADQRTAVQRVGQDFQRSIEEALGGFITRFALAEATGETPRPREVVQASDKLLHVYLDADDRMRALLDEDQLEVLDQGDFDLVMLVDFESLGKIADSAEPTW